MDTFRQALRGNGQSLALFSYLFIALSGLASAQNWTDQDIGSVGIAGSSSFDGTTYTVNGSGADINGNADACHYVYQTLTGDGELTAYVASITNTNSSAKAGVMIRQSIDPESMQALMCATYSNGIDTYQRTSYDGGTTKVNTSSSAAPYWVKIIKDGNLVTSYQSTDGVNWTFEGVTRFSFSGSVDIGFAVTSHLYGTLCTAKFSNITLTSVPSFAPGIPWHDQDIGTPAQAGQVHVEQNMWSVYGGGNGLTGTSDSFHYAYQSLKGNGEVIAQVNFLSSSSALAGVVMRNDLTTGSMEAGVLLNAASGVQYSTRTLSGGSVATSSGASYSVPYWVKLVRSGNVFSGYQSTDGQNWTQVGTSQTISMGTSIYVGVGSTCGNNGALALGVMDQVWVIPTGSYLTTGGISAGANHTLYLQPNGNVWAWGLNTNGQVGDGSTTTRTSPVQLTTLSGIVSVGAGGSHTLALDSSGNVWVWGLDSSGQLGDNATVSPTSQRITPYELPSFSTNPVVAVSAGTSHSLALDSGGYVWAWGLDANGQLGDGGTTLRNVPYQLGLKGIVAISAGGSHSMALQDDGTLWVWGNNSTGQLGDGTNTSQSSPEHLTGISNLSAISAGFSHSLVIDDNATIWAWGDNSFGEIGDGTTVQRKAPAHLINANLIGMIAVDAGNLFSLALRNDGTVWAWGNNSNGQLGNDSNAQQNSPVQAVGLSGIATISAGTSQSAVTTSSGGIFTWGGNSNGQLGNATTVASNAPQSLTPVITSLTTANATLGTPFSYTILATNNPSVYSTSTLPTGLSLTGNVISGTPSTGGTYPVTLNASNVSGTTSTTLLLTVTAWSEADVGSVSAAGSSSYSAGVYTISGCGSDINGTADAFHYVFQTLTGDGQLIARVYSISNTNPAAKAGLMVRQSYTDAGSIHCLETMTYSNGVKYYDRTTEGGSTSIAQPNASAVTPYWLKIVKSGTTISSFESANGSSWTLDEQTTLSSLVSPVYIGMAVCSHNTAQTCTATFDNISLTVPLSAAVPTFSPGAGTYSTPQVVTVSSTTPGATIYYTTDGSTPTTNSPSVATGGFITVGASQTLNAIAVAAGFGNSAVSSAVYTITAPNSPPSTGLSMWLKADAGVSVSGESPSNGGNVETWTDQTGNYTVNQTNSGNQPVYIANCLNGLPALRFSGNQWLINSGNFASAGGPGSTIITVCSTTAPANQEYAVWLGTASTSPSVSGECRSFGYAGSAQFFDASYVAVSAASVPPSGTFTAEAVSIDSTLTRVTFYRNGAQTSQPGISGLQSLNGGVTIGSQAYTGGYDAWWQGDIAEVLVYNYELTSSDLLKVSQYLSAKYGLPCNQAPSISPTAGSYTSAQTISLASGVTNGVIHYTLDGSTPSGNSPAYTGSFSISQSALIQAAVFINGKISSPTASSQFYINDAGSTGLPVTPTSFTTTLISSGEIDLSWALTGTVNYSVIDVYRSTNGGAYILVAVLDPSAISYVDLNVVGGNNYAYKVGTVNSAGASNTSPSGSLSPTSITPLTITVTAPSGAVPLP